MKEIAKKFQTRRQTQSNDYLCILKHFINNCDHVNK